MKCFTNLNERERERERERVDRPLKKNSQIIREKVSKVFALVFLFLSHWKEYFKRDKRLGLEEIY